MELDLPRHRGTLAGMDKQAVIRRVRIAVSMFFGVVTVALCLLWVASNRGQVLIRAHLPGAYDFGFVFLHGSSGLYVFKGNADWSIASEKNQMAFDMNGRQFVRPAIFFYRRIGFSQAHNFPLWVPIVASGTLAIGLGIPYSSRFSVRTLLVATTLVAVVLGLGVWLAS
jgi:hypothetical protein